MAPKVEYTAPAARPVTASLPRYEPVQTPSLRGEVGYTPQLHTAQTMRPASQITTHVPTTAPAAAPKVAEATVSERPLGLTKAEKGEIAEVTGRRTLDYAQGVRFPTKLRGNRGIDGMDVFFDPAGKIDGIDIVVEIIITESKYATGGGLPKLARTRDGVQQLSPAWMKKQMDILEKSGMHPETLRILKENPDKIRFKANVRDEFGVNRWYDYGKYDSSNFREFNAIRTPKLTGGE